MKSYSITNRRAKSISKDLLGILLERNPTDSQLAAYHSLPGWKGVNLLPNGAMAARIALEGRSLCLATVKADTIRKNYGLLWACVLVDVATLYFKPWRLRMPSGGATPYNFTEEQAQALLDENEGENDIVAQLQLLEDELVRAHDITSREEREAVVSNPDRTRAGETRRTASQLLAGIEAQRAKDQQDNAARMLALDQKAERLAEDSAEILREVRKLLDARVSFQTQTNRLEGIAQAVLVAVRASQAPAPAIAPVPVPDAPAGSGEVVTGPLSVLPAGVTTRAGTGWRTGLEND